MAKKGSYNAPGVPALWDECKTRISVTVTPTAIDGLDELAKKYGISRSELIERIGRKLLKIDESVTGEDDQKAETVDTVVENSYRGAKLVA